MVVQGGMVVFQWENGSFIIGNCGFIFGNDGFPWNSSNQNGEVKGDLPSGND